MKNTSIGVGKKQILLLCLSLIVTSLFAVPTPIKDITTLRHLEPDVAAKGLAVDLQAQVTRVHQAFSGLFVHDGSNGIYVSTNRLDLSADHFTVGDRLRIQGYTSKGEFVPRIVGTAIQIIGNEALPPAREFQANQMYSTSIDCDWVSLSGRLVSMREESVTYQNNPLVTYQRIVLELQKDNQTYLIQMPFTEETEAKLRDKLFQEVSFNAVVGTLSNDQRQMSGRVFFVNSAEDFLRVEEDPFSENSKKFPIHHLMKVNFDITKLVKTYGTVTSVTEGHITLRGEEANLLVSIPFHPEIAVGDLVIVEGIVWPQSINPAFRARRIELVQKGDSKPKPIPLSYDETIPTHFNHELVEIEATIIDWRQPLLNESNEVSEAQWQMLCRAGDASFECDILADDSIRQKLQPGALVQLTGICRLKQYENDRWSTQIEGYSLYVRNPDDIRIMQPAPKWNSERLITAVTIITVVCLSCLLWIVLLRRTVNRQTKEISRQVQQATEMEERQRIARELHDNLNQGLVGAKLQITNSKRLLKKEVTSQINALKSECNEANTAFPNKQATAPYLEQMAMGVNRCQQTLDVAQRMLIHCGNESRNAILDLRKGNLEGIDLETSIRQFIDTLTNEGGVAVSLGVEGVVPKLGPETKRNLFLICREAVTNALRHAKATTIKVRISSNQSALSLRIDDDGSGFDMEAEASENHFGLHSMYERADKLTGELILESSLGQGTSVTVLLTPPDQSSA
ncbi:MAG: sensor histidine kinase [Opitutaceae bacterium]